MRAFSVPETYSNDSLIKPALWDASLTRRRFTVGCRCTRPFGPGRWSRQFHIYRHLAPVLIARFCTSRPRTIRHETTGNGQLWFWWYSQIVEGGLSTPHDGYQAHESFPSITDRSGDSSFESDPCLGDGRF